MLSRFSLAVSILLFFGFLMPAPAQSNPQNQLPANQPYTIQANSRVVLTDVTVTDSKGNLVHGLPESTFQVFDNGKPQKIASFEEHTTTPSKFELEPAAKGVYSNDYLEHLPPVLNVVIIDIVNLKIPDQMYLNYELTKFFNEQPLVQPLAIYLCEGNGCFLLQNFSTDRTLLLNAVHKAIPRIPTPGFLSDIDTLRQIAGYLSQLPGRKNVLWFSGGSALYLLGDPTLYLDPAYWRETYDELEQARIAIYPIDVRGLLNPGGLHREEMLWAQEAEMNETAIATGGQAFHDNNGLVEITNHILSSDGSFYTLTYSPHDFHFDNKWHKVRVALNVKGYQLSYRRGYFADGSVGGAEQPEKTKARTLLLPGGKTFKLSEAQSLPIIFQARVLPTSDPAVYSDPALGGIILAPPQTGAVPYSVRYAVPVNALTKLNIGGKPQVAFGIAAIVLNRDGRAVYSHADRVTLTLNEDVLLLHPYAPLDVDLRLNLKRDCEYLSLAVWDMTSGRIGTLQVPLQVPKPNKPNRGN